MASDPFMPFILMVITLGLLYLGLRAHQARNIHTERMAAIEKGVDIKPILLNATPAFGHRLYLLRGLVWIAAGATLFVTIAVTAPFLTERRDPVDRLEFKLMRSKRMKELGATDGQIAAMETEIEGQAASRPNPAILGTLGLVPIGVGIAYLVFYGLEEKRVRSLPPS